NFGAFVDLGLAQDGLVHVSEMAGRFVRDPQQVVRVGEVTRVRVLGVDRARGRIALSLKPPPPPAPAPPPPKPAERVEAPSTPRQGPRPEGVGRPDARRRVERPSPALVRAANHRRDGLVRGERSSRGERGGRGGGGGGQGPRGGGGQGPRGGGGWGPRGGGGQGPWRGRSRETPEPEESREGPTSRSGPGPSRPFANNPFRAFFEEASPEESSAPTAPGPEAIPSPVGVLGTPAAGGEGAAQGPGEKEALLGTLEVDPSEADPRSD
ncbi:MAG: S1 RNA-binding domain-containing protein, partial [Planctomycetota bacterium]